MGQICTFFGHRFLIGFTKEHKQKLKELILDLINNHDVDTFWVSHYGDFDDTTREIVFEINKDTKEMVKVVMYNTPEDLPTPPKPEEPKPEPTPTPEEPKEEVVVEVPKTDVNSSLFYGITASISALGYGLMKKFGRR